MFHTAESNCCKFVKLSSFLPAVKQSFPLNIFGRVVPNAEIVPHSLVSQTAQIKGEAFCAPQQRVVKTLESCKDPTWTDVAKSLFSRSLNVYFTQYSCIVINPRRVMSPLKQNKYDGFSESFC